MFVNSDVFHTNSTYVSSKPTGMSTNSSPGDGKFMKQKDSFASIVRNLNNKNDVCKQWCVLY